MSERARDALGGELLPTLVTALLASGAEPSTPDDVTACIAAGRVFVNGRRCLAGDPQLAEPLRPGQRVELSALAHNTDAAPEVLDERWGLLAVLKPSGLASEPDRRGMDSLVSRLAEQLGREVHAVSRLDAQVSGVLLVATHEASRKLAASLSARAVERHYVGLVAEALVVPSASGQLAAELPTSGTWRGAIGDAGRGKRQVGGRGAKAAVTHFREVSPARLAPAEQGEVGLATWRQGRQRRALRCKLLGFQIETGRTHQIRVHAADAGYPLVGDTLYGGPGAAVLPGGNLLEFGRVALHASELVVRHAGDTWAVSSPLPEVLELWRASLLGGELPT